MMAAEIEDTTLYACDEHAFCHSCSTGKPGSYNCALVAHYYGGIDPSDIKANSTLWKSAHSALAAVRALNNDLAYWCAEVG